MMEVANILLSLILLAYCGQIAYTYTHCDSSAKKWFGWCEQWGCEKNCTCVSADECKQYCGKKLCGMMKCRSKSTCTQSLHSTRASPRALNMWAESPFVMQDCSEGKCENMVVKRSSKVQTKEKYMAFQNCVDGTCNNMVSKVEHTKQFCGNCDVMKCTGQFATNCTQKCVMGHCKRMICNAKYCEQVCSHRSTCSMECGKNAIECKQVCQLGSKCQMYCPEGKKCQQQCLGADDCKIHSKDAKFKFPDQHNGLEFPLARSIDGQNDTSSAIAPRSLKAPGDASEEYEPVKDHDTSKRYPEGSGTPKLKYTLRNEDALKGSRLVPNKKKLSPANLALQHRRHSSPLGSAYGSSSIIQPNWTTVLVILIVLAYLR